ncbi:MULTISPECIES: SEFIR domain-containing protein [Crocosphaera]|uniref:SEFIR domain-containing protein n=2 Tax=Crocosphaera watsonii TaxID=263511 RepID=T2JHL6_CROWT|nr:MULTISPECIES: SEFIR domain-containing protein [Crocosphaera]MCH2247546.1 TIR domain-containing protein [Crocosphaera sp.]CCQ64760.1 hypothetical protein CWATWH0402_4440 [Crocosphaera watsonii WH 0402]
MTTRDDNPKVFISYSWSGVEHQEFVLNLAEKLMFDGVNVLLDQWDLKEGQDKYVFMEQMVTDPEVSKVLVISDKKYAIKADNRAGGVGTESQIISNEIYTKVKQEKFIPIVTEYENGNACLPTFIKSRIYIDLSKEERFYDEYEKLLRNIYYRPQIKKPVIGKAPSYLFDENPTSVQTVSTFLSLQDAITKNKKNTKSLTKDFLEQIIESLESMRITDGNNLDEKVVESISNFKPYRDQFIKIISLFCDYDLIEKYKEDIFSFFEKLLGLHDPPKSMTSYNELWFDNFRFISMELFLYTITSLIKSKQYKIIDYFLTEKYICHSLSENKIENYCQFNQYIRVLDQYRKQRLKLNRISITADTLHDSADIKGISFDDIMQTDFILCLRSILNSSDYYERWFPFCLVYKGRWNGKPFKIFLRAESNRYFDVVKQLLKVSSKQELYEKLEKAYKTHNLSNWKFDYERIPFELYLNLDKLYDDSKN